jgi:hypothetical protein
MTSNIVDRGGGGTAPPPPAPAAAPGIPHREFLERALVAWPRDSNPRPSGYEPEESPGRLVEP